MEAWNGVERLKTILIISAKRHKDRSQNGGSCFSSLLCKGMPVRTFMKVTTFSSSKGKNVNLHGGGHPHPIRAE